MLNKKDTTKNYAEIMFNKTLQHNPRLENIIKALQILTEVKRKIKSDYGTDNLDSLLKMLNTKINNTYVTKETYEHAKIVITEYNRLREECKEILNKYK